MSMKDKLNASPDNKSFFCENWPKAKQGIEIIKTISSNFVVRLSCSLIMSVGNTLYEYTCENEQR